MNALTVVVDSDAPADGAFVPEDDGDVLLLNPNQSSESLVETAMQVPGMTVTQARALIRQHVPDAIVLSSVTMTRLPVPPPEPAPESNTRRRAAVALLLGSIFLFPLSGYALQEHAAASATTTALRGLLTDFEVKCWGRVDYDHLMRCVAENTATRVTVTRAETTGTVMLLETDHHASMVVRMETPQAAAAAVQRGIGRMLVGEQPAAIGRYVVTSTNPDMQARLERRARAADGQPAESAAPNARGPVSLRDVQVSRSTERPFLDGIPLGVSPFAPHSDPTTPPSNDADPRPVPSVTPRTTPAPAVAPTPPTPPAPEPSPTPKPSPVPTPEPEPTPLPPAEDAQEPPPPGADAVVEPDAEPEPIITT